MSVEKRSTFGEAALVATVVAAVVGPLAVVHEATKPGNDTSIQVPNNNYTPAPQPLTACGPQSPECATPAPSPTSTTLY
ncbi:MAG TPA: hypothetical protein VHB51_02105 [Candidatus Saccharimonadales bacterium]|nr:hypothetical protein [Candidatus Saccharimonadales bacterium]